MSNDATGTLKVVARKKSTLNRILKILQYKDKEYCPYRLKDCELNGDDYKDGKLYVRDFYIDSAWSIDPLFTYGDRPDIHLKEYAKDKNGNMIQIKDDKGNFKGYKEIDLPPHFTDLCHLAKVLDFGCECFITEPGMMFEQHFSCNHKGELVYNETGHYEEKFHYKKNGDIDDSVEPEEEHGLEDFMEFAFASEIYGD